MTLSQDRVLTRGGERISKAADSGGLLCGNERENLTAKTHTVSTLKDAVLTKTVRVVV